MKQQEIQKCNKQIALMLGAIYSEIAEAWGFGNARIEDKEITIQGKPHKNLVLAERWEKELKFHSDWNWLMEAVEFIEKIKTETSTFTVHTNPNSILFKEERNYSFEKGDGGRTTQPFKINGKVWIIGQNRKEALFKAVSDFAKLYNNKELL